MKASILMIVFVLATLFLASKGEEMDSVENLIQKRGKKKFNESCRSSFDCESRTFCENNKCSKWPKGTNCAVFNYPYCDCVNGICA